MGNKKLGGVGETRRRLENASLASKSYRGPKKKKKKTQNHKLNLPEKGLSRRGIGWGSNKNSFLA